VFHQFIRVGRLAICQGASGFSKDIPPFAMAAERNGVAGLNVVGLRRAGIGLNNARKSKLRSPCSTAAD
jgi:UDP-N-acetylglucosamine acyltransferase